MIIEHLARFFMMKRRFRTATPRTLRRFQQRRVRKILTAVKNHSPFFREYLGSHDPRSITLEELDALTPIDRHIMMDNFNDYVTVGLARENDR